MFQNLTKIANAVGQLADVLAVNIDSVNNLSKAGNEKSLLVLDASKYDVARQRVDLDNRLALLTAELKAIPIS
ncbi:MAG: hypothetical protein H8D87_02280 [Deltaproteobacteria bacterium]|nr:hypothetical protein [Candidatus Desulfobacula maris]